MQNLVPREPEGNLLFMFKTDRRRHTVVSTALWLGAVGLTWFFNSVRRIPRLVTLEQCSYVEMVSKSVCAEGWAELDSL